jgi:hypothetical protein
MPELPPTMKKVLASTLHSPDFASRLPKTNHDHGGDDVNYNSRPRVLKSTTAHSFKAIRENWDPERKSNCTLIIRPENASGVGIPRETIVFLTGTGIIIFRKELTRRTN